VIYTADEPTGGTHCSLVLAGGFKISFDEAERYKRAPENHKEILPLLRPVIEKMSGIIKKHVAGYDVDEIALVGGSCCLEGIEDIIEKETGIACGKPKNPLFVTPLGIAMCCGRGVSGKEG
jgi:ethanolamine utilization protein EutJ